MQTSNSDASAAGPPGPRFAPVQLLGLCPLLAVSNTIANALGLAAATALVLIGSATVVSALRHAIPRDVRLPCFVLVVAAFTTLANLAIEAWAFGLYERIALFVQIIVTNCLILGRLEQVAAREPLRRTLLDALRVAAFFAAAIACLGGVRQLLAVAFPLAAAPAGAFVIAGLLLALAAAIRQRAQTAGLARGRPAERGPARFRQGVP